MYHKLNILHTVIKTGWTVPPPPPRKTVKLHDNNKPWVTANSKKIIEKGQRAFREGQESQLRRLQNSANRESKRLKSTYLKRKVEELQLYPNAKKWWQCIKQLAGFPKKKILSNSVVDDQVLTGKDLAQKTNDVCLIYPRYSPS